MTPEQQQKVNEARAVLAKLGFPKQQTNEQAALVLLALLDLRPDRSWSDANNTWLLRVHVILAWILTHYGKQYEREMVRRRALHQFVAAGLIAYNPDNPERPVNSPANCYRVCQDALDLLQTHDHHGLDERIRAYLATNPGLSEEYAATRGMSTIAVTLADGTDVVLTAGGQNKLIKLMIEQFCSRWTQGGQALYVGDAGAHDPIFDVEAFASLGVSLDKHGKLPDLVVYMPDRNWLVLMEAASTHGPVDGKRHAELTKLFGNSSAGLVFVSCFPTKAEMRRYMTDDGIAWETEAWCADSPEHLIHFNGERFLGPYS